MSSNRIGVGIIGAQPGRSWAAVAHIPALRTLPDFELVALSTSRPESAREAAEAFGVRHHFANHHDLVSLPDVQLVVVSVKVPAHRELVDAALAAGKMVYCEWPLGNGLAEAEAMAEWAKRAGVRTFVGLQARSAPEINFVRDLVKDGYVGEVLSTTLVASGANWGPVIEQPNAYTADRSTGATMLAIPFGHTVDAVCQCLGSFSEVTGTLANRRTSFTVAETGERRPMTTHDQVAVTGVLESGAVATVHYRGGLNRGTNMLWEINGTEGDLQVTSFGGHAQIFPLTVLGGRGDDKAVKPLDLPAKYRWASPEATGPALNIAQAYGSLLRDLNEGTHLLPDFADAVATHRLLAAIEQAAETGSRVKL